uniref:Uncharacterized protein n=1 Tax=Siphoviridae sp. ct0X023 TaxID=2825295 RepID=A0A8S5P2T3_9CAUD|nr:MAG TPA: hypothetical protein [Siphoviridae sp. ct0X023]
MKAHRIMYHHYNKVTKDEYNRNLTKSVWLDW